MRYYFLLQFLTLAFTPLQLGLACLLAAAISGFTVWVVCRNSVKKSALQDEREKKKLELLTFLTHELRTPMTLITTPLQKLTRNSYDEDTNNELKAIQKNADKIVVLLNKTLNVDKIGNDGSDMRFREINLVKYLYNLQTLFSYQSLSSQVELAFHCDKDRIGVWLDRNRFDEVLMNLINHEINSTPAGGKVEIELTSDDKSAIIVIKNTGSRIEEDKIPHLFELFQRSESGTVSGTNIELYLCNDIVSKHKGTITASNRNDCEGSCYTITLPLGNSHLPKNRLTDRESLNDETWKNIDSTSGADTDKASVPGRKYSIIAIDTNPDICLYLKAMLARGFNITTYTDPTEGLNAAITHIPDLVIAEVMMTGLDGIELTKRLKSNSNTAHIPIMLLTAMPGEDVRVRGFLSGADAIISMPFNEDEIILNCNNLIKSRSRLASHIKDMQIAKDVIQPIELQSNDDALMQKVLSVINERISDPELNVEMLAEAIGISRGHLHRKIKEITNSSPGEYIRAIRLNQAAQLLRGEKKNISQISYSVGYSNPSVFSTAFKQFFGISAKDYQKKYSGPAEPESDQTRQQP